MKRLLFLTTAFATCLFTVNAIINDTPQKKPLIKHDSAITEKGKQVVTPHTDPQLFEVVEQYTDDFNGTEIDKSKWNTPCRPFATVSFSPDNVKQEDGNLNITIKHHEHDFSKAFPHYYFQSGMLNSKGKVTYGYFEARIKGAHVFRGTCPAFWLYSLPGDGKKIKPQKENTVVYNEIDIIELQQVPKDFHIMSCDYHIMVLKPDGTNPDGSEKFTNKFLHPQSMWGHNETVVDWDSRDDYHLYACENRPDSIIWYIDNKRVASVPNYYWHLGMYITLSMEPRTPFEKWNNGKRYPVPTTKEQADAAGFPSTMKVDYIRTWRRKDYSQFKSSKREYNPNDF